jgi:hypothetical protein
MKTLKLVWPSIIRLVRQVCRIPRNIRKAIKQRRRQTVLDKYEAERLDRICNPSKYRGK